MIPTAWNSSRRLVPRWRSLSATLRSQELALPLRGGHEAYDNGDFVAKLERWRLSPGLVTAAELLEASIVEGRESEAVSAARRLVTIDQDAAPLIRQQAAALLVRTGNAQDVPSDVIVRESHAAQPRYYTRINPRDPLAWVELSLHQTISGHPEAALRSMKVALSLAPENRHVLRSAARLFLHTGDPERAHDLIARAAPTGGDPWLIASEIALAQVADCRSRFIKSGMQILKGGSHSARQLTELAAAVGTEELLSGNRRRARKDFVQSLIDPTGNALAQTEWATPEFGHDFVPVARLKSTLEPAEAQAFHLYRTGHFRYVADVCWSWASADPFSIRPYEFGAATAGFIEQYHKAVRLAERGLELRPDAPELLNSAAYALASLGRVEEASKMLDRLGSPDDDRLKCWAAANRGLVAFRAGNEELGKAFYRQSIEGYAKAGFAELSARARIYLAREAVLARSPDAGDLLGQAQKAMKPFDKVESVITLNRVIQLSQHVRTKDHLATPGRSDLAPDPAPPPTPAVSLPEQARGGD